jgi:hypothetical protein
MIVLFTDFGLHGPYTGQMKAVLHQMAPGVPAIDRRCARGQSQSVCIPVGGLCHMVPSGNHLSHRR